MRCFVILSGIAIFRFSESVASAIDPLAGGDPYWVLLHEPAVLAELKLSAEQRRSFQKLTDELDLSFFPLRNQSPAAAQVGTAEITGKARDALDKLLQPGQRKRLTEILLRRLGNEGLLHADVVKRLRYSETQRRRIGEINETTSAAVAALRKEGAEGKPIAPLEQRFNALQADQQKQLIDVLRPEQRAAYKTLLGPPFDLAKLGHAAYKAPEILDSGEWINSDPLNLEQLRGKVVVIHFYACGCINCIHNYPWYQQWHERFRDRNVVLIGIHTPETASERESANVRRKAAEAKFEFPILIDGKFENWKAWGNSMWPAVYLIDKRGYLRDFWPGELKWQGQDGEKYLRERIEELLLERSS